NEDSDQDSVVDEPGEEEPYHGRLEHLDRVKAFILESQAYQALHGRLFDFIYPSSRSRLRDLIATWSRKDHKYHAHVSRYGLSNLAAELQYIDPHQLRFYDDEDDRRYAPETINCFQNAVERWTRESWDWSPLPPCSRPLKNGRETRVRWKCTCGEERWAELAQIPVAELSSHIFFSTLREKYFQLRGFLRSWLSVWRYAHCDFYKACKFDDHEFVPKQKDSFPDARNTDYIYQPRPIDSIPPISKHEFQRRFYAC
ncbi:hypothetical protein V8F06_014931, partial [Rhypophila decipiens]